MGAVGARLLGVHWALPLLLLTGEYGRASPLLARAPLIQGLAEAGEALTPLFPFGSGGSRDNGDDDGGAVKCETERQTESSTGPHCVPRVHTGPLSSLPAYYLGAGLEVLVGEHSLYC